MSRITPVSAKKRKLEEAMRGKTSKPRKRIRKQKDYHSSSDDDEDVDTGFAPVSLGDSDDEVSKPAKKMTSEKKLKKNKKPDLPTKEAKSSKKTKHKAAPELSPSSGSEENDKGDEDPPMAEHNLSSASDSDASSQTDDGSNPDTSASIRTPKPKSKRNDPTAFSTSISKILSTKLPKSTSDPVLSRSIAAQASAQFAANTRLEARARAKLRADKQAAMQKGRTTDVLGIERGITGEVAEKEKQLRKIAQRGVIQLFNAFRTAHERAEEARREERRKGTVGIGERERKVNEVSKEGFLELIGGKKKAAEAT